MDWRNLGGTYEKKQLQSNRRKLEGKIKRTEEAIEACEFVEELLKEMIAEMKNGTAKNYVADGIIQSYVDANWAVGDLAEEIEMMDKV